MRWLIPLLLLLAGCGPHCAPFTSGELVNVSIVLTHDGTPLPDELVRWDGQGHFCETLTDEQGVVYAHLLPGEYSLSVGESSTRFVVDKGIRNVFLDI